MFSLRKIKSDFGGFENWKSFWTESKLTPKSKWIEWMKFYSIDFGNDDLNSDYDNGILVSAYWSGNGKTWTIRVWTDIKRSDVERINDGKDFRNTLFLNDELYGESFKISSLENPLKLLKDKISDAVDEILKDTGIETLKKIRSRITRELSGIKDPVDYSLKKLEKAIIKSLNKELTTSKKIIKDLQTEQGKLLNQQSQLSRRFYKNLNIKNVGLRGVQKFDELEEQKSKLIDLQKKARLETFQQVKIMKNVKTIKKITNTRRLRNVKDVPSGAGWLIRKVASISIFIL